MRVGLVIWVSALHALALWFAWNHLWFDAIWPALLGLAFAFSWPERARPRR